MSTEKREFKLEKSKDWDVWLSIIKSKAIVYQIWDKIDSTLAIQPDCLQKPQAVQKPTANAIATDPDVYTTYKFELAVHKAELTEWKEQHEGFSKIIDVIHDTVSLTNLTYIQKVKMHLWSILKALKARLAPSDSARIIKFEKEYSRLMKCPSRQNVEAWLNDYIQLYILEKEYNIAEIGNTHRAFRNFILAIEQLASILAQQYESQLDKTENKKELLFKLIEKFRNHIRLRDVKKIPNTTDNSAFSVSRTSSSESKSRITFRGNSSKLGLCFCDRTHWWSDCYYLNEKIRSTDWKSNEKTQKKIDEKLNEPEIKAKVEKVIARNDDIQRKNESSKDIKEAKEQFADSSKDADVHEVFSVRSVTEEYPLRFSWILDHDSDIHVVNDFMQHRFIKERDCTDGFTVAAGNGLLPIKAYERIQINIQAATAIGNGKEKGIIELTNVAYIPDFMINIVSGSILEAKELHFDTEHHHLHRKGKAVFFAPRVENHYVLENNTKSTANVFSAKATSAAKSIAAEEVNKEPAPTSRAAPPKISLSVIISFQIAPASSTPKAASSSKAAASKAASPLIPPATPPKTWTAVISKSAAKSASKLAVAAVAASPLTPPPIPLQTPLQACHKRVQKPLKLYLTVHDLYQMFHVKESPHQTSKSMVQSVMRNSKRNTHLTSKNIAKMQALSPTSPAALKRETPPITWATVASKSAAVISKSAVKPASKSASNLAVAAVAAVAASPLTTPHIPHYLQLRNAPNRLRQKLGNQPKYFIRSLLA